MKKILLFFMVVTMLMTTVLAVNAASTVDQSCAYKVGDEFIAFIQADDTNFVTLGAKNSWSVSSFEGAMGNKALVNHTKASDALGDGLTVTFSVPADGEYTIWGRVYYPGQNSNSLFYNFDGHGSYIWDFPDEEDQTFPVPACYGRWQYFYLTERLAGNYTDTSKYGDWTIANNEWRHSPNRVYLKAGEHSFKLTAREAGVCLDEIVITSYTTEEYDPNIYEGNSAYLKECSFCGTARKHYYQDTYSALSITAQDYFTTNLHPEAVVWDKTQSDVVETTQVFENSQNTNEVTNVGESTTNNEKDTITINLGCDSMLSFPVVAMVATVASACVIKRRRKK